MNQQNFSQVIERDIFLENTLKLLNSRFDIIFMDPPYKEKKVLNILNTIIKLNLLKENGVIIIHRHRKEEDIFPEKFKTVINKNYGISKIIFGNNLA